MASGVPMANIADSLKYEEVLLFRCTVSGNHMSIKIGGFTDQSVAITSAPSLA
jgi:hypothetical protein